MKPLTSAEATMSYKSLVLLCAYFFHGGKAINDIPKYTVTTIGERCELGEGPFWAADVQLLYWVDMRQNLLNSYDPATDKHVRVRVETDRTPVTLMIRVLGTKDRFIVGIQGSLAVVRWDGRSTEPLVPFYFADLEDRNGSSRLNDGKADPQNRLWVGSMGAQLSSNPNVFEKGKGSLYMVTPDGSVQKKVGGLELSNGIEWSLDADKMYFVDSLAFKVYQFDYANTDGSIKNQKVIFDLHQRGMVEAQNSLPDGMTIDHQGMLWVSVYGTKKVIRINPNSGELLMEITLDKVLQPTSVAFGGPNLDILFVTTAHVDWNEELEKDYPLSGHLLKIEGLGVQGYASRDVDLSDTLWQKSCNGVKEAGVTFVNTLFIIGLILFVFSSG